MNPTDLLQKNYEEKKSIEANILKYFLEKFEPFRKLLTLKDGEFFSVSTNDGSFSIKSPELSFIEHFNEFYKKNSEFLGEYFSLGYDGTTVYITIQSGNDDDYVRLSHKFDGE